MQKFLFLKFEKLSLLIEEVKLDDPFYVLLISDGLEIWKI